MEKYSAPFFFRHGVMLPVGFPKEKCGNIYNRSHIALQTLL